MQDETMLWQEKDTLVLISERDSFYAVYKGAHKLKYRDCDTRFNIYLEGAVFVSRFLICHFVFECCCLVWCMRKREWIIEIVRSLFSLKKILSTFEG